MMAEREDWRDSGTQEDLAGLSAAEQRKCCGRVVQPEMMGDHARDIKAIPSERDHLGNLAEMIIPAANRPDIAPDEIAAGRQHFFLRFANKDDDSALAHRQEAIGDGTPSTRKPRISTPLTRAVEFPAISRIFTMGSPTGFTYCELKRTRCPARADWYAPRIILMQTLPSSAVARGGASPFR